MKESPPFWLHNGSIFVPAQRKSFFPASLPRIVLPGDSRTAGGARLFFVFQIGAVALHTEDDWQILMSGDD